MRAFKFDPESLLSLDKTMHEPARLTIVACLAELEEADFVFIQSQTGMTVGNLSSHIRKLEQTGYLQVKKEFKDNRPHTTLRLTEAGKQTFDDYIKTLRDFLNTVSA